MVRACIVCFCREGSTKDVTFHLLPSNTSLRHVWLKRLNRQDLKDFSKRVVCSRHFPPSAFANKPRRNSSVTARRRLKLDALPIEVDTPSVINTVTHSQSTTTQTDLDMITLTDLLDKLSLIERNPISTIICIERFRNDNNTINYYTGFRSYNIFNMVFELLEVRNRSFYLTTTIFFLDPF